MWLAELERTAFPMVWICIYTYYVHPVDLYQLRARHFIDEEKERFANWIKSDQLFYFKLRLLRLLYVLLT